MDNLGTVQFHITRHDKRICRTGSIPRYKNDNSAALDCLLAETRSSLHVYDPKKSAKVSQNLQQEVDYLLHKTNYLFHRHD